MRRYSPRRSSQPCGRADLARTICSWTGKLPEDCRETADEILLAGALTGLGLAGLAGEICARSLAAPGDNDSGHGDEDGAFEERAVRVATTFGGAGVLTGDLTPECAEVVRAVLSAPAGADDDRTRARRYHDGLVEAMR